MFLEPVEYVPGGAIFEEWPHDAANPSDRYFYGQCAECGWHDNCDHRDIHVAEQALVEHKHLETS